MREGNTQGTLGYIQLPAGTTAQRPGSPVAGMMRYNTTLSGWDTYDGTNWDTFKTVSLTGSDAVASEPMHFVYDTARSAFLSSATMNFYYIAGSVAVNDFINYNGLFTSDSGIIMPYDGTITAMTVYLTDVNLVSRTVSIYTDLTENTSQMLIGNVAGTSDGVYSTSKTNVNLNFSAGQKIRMQVRASSGTSSKAWAGFNLHLFAKWRTT